MAQKEIPKGNAKEKVKRVYLSLDTDNPCPHLTIKMRTLDLIPHTKQHFVVV